MPTEKIQTTERIEWDRRSVLNKNSDYSNPWYPIHTYTMAFNGKPIDIRHVKDTVMNIIDELREDKEIRKINSHYSVILENGKKYDVVDSLLSEAKKNLEVVLTSKTAIRIKFNGKSALFDKEISEISMEIFKRIDDAMQRIAAGKSAERRAYP